MVRAVHAGAGHRNPLICGEHMTGTMVCLSATGGNMRLSVQINNTSRIEADGDRVIAHSECDIRPYLRECFTIDFDTSAAVNNLIHALTQVRDDLIASGR